MSSEHILMRLCGCVNNTDQEISLGCEKSRICTDCIWLDWAARRTNCCRILAAFGSTSSSVQPVSTAVPDKEKVQESRQNFFSCNLVNREGVLVLRGVRGYWAGCVFAVKVKNVHEIHFWSIVGFFHRD